MNKKLIYRQRTFDNHPNLSVVMPGPCHGACSFCFWKEEPACDGWLSNLSLICSRLPKKYRQVSVTGGEPTLSPLLFEALPILRERFGKVVMTTSARINDNLGEHGIARLSKYIDHLNISRHHYVDDVNSAIFNTSQVPGERILFDMCDDANMHGLDVNLNCVLCEGELKDATDVLKFIAFAKDVGASSVCFRKPHGDITPHSLEADFNVFPVLYTGGCPVCRMITQRIRGFMVNWKSSEFDTEGKTIYELIYHPSGVLSADWEGKRPIEPLKKKYVSRSAASSAASCRIHTSHC